ncbi:MAG: hypothetical protein AAFX99_37315, partial [Myxococcota bacterium]
HVRGQFRRLGHRHLFFQLIAEPVRKDSAKIVPDDAILDRIARIYAADFERFGYKLEEKMPVAQAPELPSDVLAAQAANAQQTPGHTLKRKVQSLFGK